jgi:hypothetical protein
MVFIWGNENRFNLILKDSYPRNTIVNYLRPQNERNIIMKNNVKTTEKKWLPANADVLTTVAQAPNFEVEYDERSGKPIAYHTPFKPIKVLLENPWYNNLDMKGLSLTEAFNTLEEVYTKEGASARAVRLYNKFQNYIKKYNQELVEKIKPHLFVNQADTKLGASIWYAKQNYNTRWLELHCDLDSSLHSYKYYDNLSEEDRELLLARASDYGIYPASYVGHAKTKEIYTFRKGELEEEAEQPNEPSDALLEAEHCLKVCWTELDLKIQQHASGASIARTLDKIIFIKSKLSSLSIGDSLHWLRPMDTYYKVGENGYEGTELVTLAGKYTYRELFKRRAENEAMAMAEILAKEYGDEFLETVTTPAGVVTKRDIRLGLVEDEPLDWHDFQYESYTETDERFNEDEFDEYSFLGYDKIDSPDEELKDEYTLCREAEEEDELDYMNGTEL